MNLLPSLDPLAGWLAVACLATLLAHAAAVKLLDQPLFEQHLAAYGVRLGTGWLAVAVPLTEALTAALLISPWRSIGGLMAAGLLLAYAVLMGWQRLSGREIDCGCGSEPLPVSWLLVARNLVLSLLALTTLMPLDTRELGLGDFAVVVVATLVATVIYAAAHQILRQQGAARRATRGGHGQAW